MKAVCALLVLTLAACDTDPTGTFVQTSRSQQHADDAPRFSDWSAPVNLGPPVNSAFGQQNPFISKNGLSLYFDCGNCPGNIPAPGGGPSRDIYVSQRASVDEPWGPPQPVTALNTPFNEGGVSLSQGGHQLYFFSGDRPDGLGGNDIYVSRRHDKRDDFGWQPAENLGGVNTPFSEGGPETFEDDATGAVTLCFASDKPGGPGLTDIYCSTQQPDGTYGPSVLAEGLNTPSREETPAIRRDGLEIVLGSDRPGSQGSGVQGVDLWVATRASTSDPWSTPVNVGPVVNGPTQDATPALSWKGTELYFASPRPGNVGSTMFDIWVATRIKLTGHGDDEDVGRRR